VTKQKNEIMRRALPYGKYIFTNGSQILFNRYYETLLQTDVENPELKNDRGERVYNEKIVKAKKIWFYTDKNPPWRDKEALRKCQSVLDAFGVQ